jgi:hypothetical protein
MVQRVKDLVDRDLYAAMILQGLVIRDGIGNMANAAEMAVAQAEALVAELRRDTGDDLPPQPFANDDQG